MAASTDAEICGTCIIVDTWYLYLTYEQLLNRICPRVSLVLYDSYPMNLLSSAFLSETTGTG